VSNWGELFALSVPAMELIVRGTSMYFFLFLLFRFFFRRDTGSIGVADVLLVVLIADASQNAMAGEYRSITDGIVLVSTIAFWNFVLDWLAYRFSIVERILEPGPLCLVRNGRVQHDNLRREFISKDELLSKVREKGFADLNAVKDVYLESSGEVSVIGK
jgi:uncharacterized membrane protein YcaP (DUF421 family)